MSFLCDSICDLTVIKLDQILNSDFTEQETREFEQQWRVPVLRIANVTGRRLADGRGLDGRADITVGHQNTSLPASPQGTQSWQGCSLTSCD